MKRQLSLQHRLQTLSALQDAVGAMRSLAAHHFRIARQALPAARQYRSEMDSVIGEIGIRQQMDISEPTGLLVISSDLGLCGDYNSRMSQRALEEAHVHADAVIYAVGRHSRSALNKNGFIAIRNYDAPASLQGMTRLLLGLAQDILEDFLANKIGSLQVISAGFEGVGHFSVFSTRVLPVQPSKKEQPVRPSPYVDSNHLATVAVREYLYITLYEILLDAIAAEHGMRLMAAESALEWLDDTSTTTARRLTVARNEAANQELLDIVAGGRGGRRGGKKP